MSKPGGDANAGKSMISKVQNQGQNNGRYKFFTDEAKDITGKTRGGFEYTGDGQEQEDFFKKYSNYDELISNMTRDEREAFREWARGDFMDGVMFKDWDDMHGTYLDIDTAHEYTKVFDKILDKATLNHGVIVSRDSTAELIFGKGHKTASLEELKAAEGTIIKSKSAMSTGAAATGLSIGDSSKQILYRISIPAGAKGAGMWIADSRIHGWGRDQREFMTNRDSVFKVGKTVYDKRLKKYIVQLKWVGHSKHDYGKGSTARNWA